MNTQVEWSGLESKKFPGTRMHINPPTPKETPHPLFTMLGKRKYEKKETPTYEWKPSIKVVGPVDHTNDK